MPAGNIILLNGAASADKTSIVQALQAGPPPTAMRWLKAWSDPAKHQGWTKQLP